MFEVSVVSMVGDGRRCFGTDSWLPGGSITNLAPKLSAELSKRIFIQRTLHDVVMNIE
jgi:hypothetical protein